MVSVETCLFIVQTDWLYQIIGGVNSGFECDQCASVLLFLWYKWIIGGCDVELEYPELV